MTAAREIGGREVRLRAAELIEERGWRQEVRRGELTTLCAAEAVSAATEELAGGDIGGAGWRGLNEAAHSPIFGGSVLALVRWNDERGRTEDEVLELLRSAA
jgi:hypothetical protein